MYIKAFWKATFCQGLYFVVVLNVDLKRQFFELLLLQLGLCDMTIYIGGRNKKSIVSYFALSFISWCRKIHCLR